MSLICWYFRAYPLKHPAGLTGLSLAAGPSPFSYMDGAGYPNMLSKKPKHIEQGAAPWGQRELPNTRTSIFIAYFKGSDGTDLALYMHHCICITDISLVTVTSLHAVNVFIGDTGPDPSFIVNFYGLISQTSGLAAGGFLHQPLLPEVPGLG